MAENTDETFENPKLMEDGCQFSATDADVTDAFDRVLKIGSLAVTRRTYNMSHPRRGEAIIFNHSFFLNHQSERKGTASDVENLVKALLRLGFSPEDIHIYDNLTAAGISCVLKGVQKKDHTDCDMLMIFVLTHGKHNDKILAYDVEYSVENLWEPFRADVCKSLAGKPKIFFVVACRGQNMDEGQRLDIEENGSLTEVDAKPIQNNDSYVIPVWADFLCVFSTFKGYYSYRNVEDGTWYIQSFCEELSTTNLSEVSFLDFLAAVNGRLSRSFETQFLSSTIKQISTFNSTFTKSLYFSKGTAV